MPWWKAWAMPARPTLLAPAICILALACGSSTEPVEVGRYPIRTDSDAYSLTPTDIGLETVIGYTYTNRTGETVYIPNCGGQFHLHLEKWEDGDWVGAWSRGILACQSPPIVIPPGGRYSDTLRVLDGDPDLNLQPRFGVAEIDGTYRMVFLQVVHRYDGSPPRPEDHVPLEERISNIFLLHVE